MVQSKRWHVAVPILLSALWLASLTVVASAELPDTTPAPTLPVRVQVLEFETDAPLAGVTIYVNEHVVGQTDAEGVAVVRVSRGTSVIIAVDLDGYYALGVEDIIWSAGESWQFWLKPMAAVPTGTRL